MQTSPSKAAAYSLSLGILTLVLFLSLLLGNILGLPHCTLSHYGISLSYPVSVVVCSFSAAIAVWAFSRLALLLYGQTSKALAICVTLLTLGQIAVPTFMLNPAVTAWALLALGLLSFFENRGSAFVWFTLAAMLRPELLMPLLVFLLLNIAQRRVEIRSMILSIALSAIPLYLLHYFFAAGIHIHEYFAFLNSSYTNSSEFMANAAATLIGSGLFSSYPLLVMTYFALLTVAAIYFFLSQLSAAEYLARDQRKLPILLSGLLIFLLFLIKHVRLEYWLTPSYMLSVLFVLLLAAFTKKSLPLRLIALLILIPNILAPIKELRSERLSSPSGSCEPLAPSQP